MYPIGTILVVDRGWYKHVGVQLARGLVLHNCPERGEEAITLDRFSEGKPVRAKRPEKFNLIEFLARVRQMLTNPKPYHLILNNCEHTVSKALYGVRNSPQLIGFGITGLAILGFCLIRKK